MADADGLEFRLQVLDLLRGKHRPLLADISAADIASAAFAHPAFHTVFQRGVNIIILKTQSMQAKQAKLDHGRWTTQNRRASLW